MLDDFEDQVYDLSPIDLVDGRAGWYICPDPGNAASESWDYQAFARAELAAYVVNCRAWRSR